MDLEKKILNYSQIKSVHLEWLDTEIDKQFNKLDNDKYRDFEIVKQKWKLLLLFFSEYGPITRGNKVELFDNSRSVLNAMINEIDSAKERVWLETYIFDNCEIAKRFVDSLCNASRRGCDVILLVDWIGSCNIPNEWLKKLRQSGVNIVWFNPLFNKSVGPIVFRDHRKILITDNIAFCGSLNLSATSKLKSYIYEEADLDKYSNVNNRKRYFSYRIASFLYSKISSWNLIYRRPWFYDVHAKIKGPAIYDLAKVFLDSLKESRSDLKRDIFIRPDEYEDGCVLQVLLSNTRKQNKGIQNVLAIATSNANWNVFLTTSYFMPPGFLRRAIQNSIKNNIEVSLLLSGNSDILGDTMASKYFLKKLFAKKNARFFFTKDAHCHAKYIVIDSIWSSFGSFNWDRFSSRRNLEVSVAAFDPQIAQQLISMQNKFTKSIEKSEELTYDRLYSQHYFSLFISKIMYNVVRLLGRNWLDGLSPSNSKSKKSYIRSSIIDLSSYHILCNGIWN
ncbi:hypothetical protein cand_000430 [Cryptosporidium andersoni]|uniref:PLD phosphodiesterase domain-containing protein n=1 Tax=Cryptosporidium andersoni TaxID=117008 RepID=A0A1J4MQK1_9CRYT|nr:hypothetical protein cand_000430 [Cryptosporidium andersoni]